MSLAGPFAYVNARQMGQVGGAAHILKCCVGLPTAPNSLHVVWVERTRHLPPVLELRALTIPPCHAAAAGILYAKYKAEKLMEHLKLFAARLNIPRLIRVCEEQQHWRELVFLYVAYDEYDNAALVMMAHRCRSPAPCYLRCQQKSSIASRNVLM